MLIGDPMTFQTLPKVELHLHLDCSLSHAVASRLDPGLTQEAFERDFIEPEIRGRIRQKLLAAYGDPA